MSGARGLDKPRMREDHIGLMLAISQGGLAQHFYRYARPGEL